jgi:predicted transposase/invertase (TIGR01784 family)
MRTYEESLKVYRDNYSVIETAKREGASEKEIEIARKMKKEGLTADQIARITGLTEQQIEKL